MSRPIHPGEIYELVLGEEQGHRAIVISAECFNRGKYVIVVPVTSSRFEERRHLPNCVVFAPGQFSFDRNCVARAERTTLVFKCDLSIDAGPIDQLDGAAMWNLTKAIGVVLCADCVPLTDDASADPS